MLTFESSTVKPSAVEISSVVPVEIRTVVFVVYPVTVVAIPYGVVIVSIPGEFCFIDDCCGRLGAIVLVVPIIILVHRCRRRILLIDNRRRRGRCGYIYPCSGNAKSDMGTYIYL